VVFKKSKKSWIVTSQGFVNVCKRDIQLEVLVVYWMLTIGQQASTNRDATHVANLDKQVPIS